jgi:hypothetical protein
MDPLNLVIRVGGNVTIGDYTGTSLHILAGGRVDVTGDIRITGPDTSSMTVDGAVRPTLDIRAGTTEFLPPTLSSVTSPPFTLLPTFTTPGTSADIRIGGRISMAAGADNGQVLLTNQRASNDLPGDIEVREITTTIFTVGGDIVVDSRGKLTVQEQISTFSFGDAGTVKLFANDDIVTQGIDTVSSPASTDPGGDIEIVSHRGMIDISGQLFNSGVVGGQGGNITLRGQAGIQARNSILNSTGATGGMIILESGGGSIDTTNSLLNSGPLPNQVQNRLAGSGITLDSQVTALLNLAGEGAEIELTAGGDIKTGIINTGAHNLNIGADGQLQVTNSILNTGLRNGLNGDISLRGDRGIIIDSSIIHSDAETAGGKISLNSDASGIDIIDSFVNSGKISSTKIGQLAESGIDFFLFSPDNDNLDPGKLELNASRNITVEGSFLGSSGDAIELGSSAALTLITDAGILLKNVILFGGSDQGEGSEIKLEAQSISTNNTLIQTSNELRQNVRAGAIVLDALDFINLDQSAVVTRTRNDQPNSNIVILTGRLVLESGTIVSTSTDSKSESVSTAASIRIDADTVELMGSTTNSTILTNPLTTRFNVLNLEAIVPTSLISLSAGPGQAGNISIDTERLFVRDGALISTGSISAGAEAGAGGNISINASESIVLSNNANNQFLTSGISVDTLTSQPAGQLEIITPKLEITGGAGISASTLGSGQGGNINITTTDILVQGTSPDRQINSGIYAQSFSTGNAGGIRLNTSTLNLQDQARLEHRYRSEAHGIQEIKGSSKQESDITQRS